MGVEEVRYVVAAKVRVVPRLVAAASLCELLNNLEASLTLHGGGDQRAVVEATEEQVAARADRQAKWVAPGRKPKRPGGHRVAVRNHLRVHDRQSAMGVVRRQLAHRRDELAEQRIEFGLFNRARRYTGAQRRPTEDPEGPGVDQGPTRRRSPGVGHQDRLVVRVIRQLIGSPAAPGRDDLYLLHRARVAHYHTIVSVADPDVTQIVDQETVGPLRVEGLGEAGEAGEITKHCPHEL